MVVGTILIFAFLLVFAISIIIIFVVITEQKSNPETCSSQLDCIQGYVCDGNQTCVPGLGTHCTSEDPCISPFVCSNNICVLGDDSELTNSMNPSSESIYYDFLPKVKSTKTFSNPTIRNIRETYASNGVSSEDNEINSNGSKEDESRFYIASNDSSEYSKAPITTQNKVVDICMYGTTSLFLFQDGTIKFHDNKTFQEGLISNTVQLKRIVVFQNGVYGLGKDGNLYKPKALVYKHESYWDWELVTWSPTKQNKNDYHSNIEWISSSHNGSWLWISTKNYGYLYNQPSIVYQTTKGKEYRNYGWDNEHYVLLSLDEYTATTYPEKKVYNDVKYAVLDHKNTILVLKTTYEESMILFHQWKPMYV